MFTSPTKDLHAMWDYDTVTILIDYKRVKDLSVALFGDNKSEIDELIESLVSLYFIEHSPATEGVLARHIFKITRLLDTLVKDKNANEINQRLSELIPIITKQHLPGFDNYKENHWEAVLGVSKFSNTVFKIKVEARLLKRIYT
jgi:hypothetical protein